VTIDQELQLVMLWLMAFIFGALSGRL